MALRLLHMSDIHFGSEDVPAVEAATAFAKATPYDLLVVSGDITQFGLVAEFDAASAWLAGLPGPHLVTPGNHDTPWAGLVDRVVSPFARYASAIGPPESTTFRSDDIQGEALNSARGWQVRINWSKGEVSGGQVRRAIKGLAGGAPDAIRLVTCHHPLIEVPGGPMTARVRGGRLAAIRLARAGVDVILTGHLHAPFVQALPYGDGRTYAVGAGTLSLRERGAPPSFNLIEIDQDKMVVTAVAWSPKGLDLSETWSVQLRPRKSDFEEAA